MLLCEREYNVYALFGDPSLEPPWIEARWREIAAILEPLMAATGSKGAVRSTQTYFPPGSSAARPMSFGRIGWNEKGHQKWTHSISGHVGGETSVKFLDVEIWAPSWNDMVRDRKAPDLYCSIVNKAHYSPSDFNPLCILAVAADHAELQEETAREAASLIAETIGSMMRVHSRRPWGYSLPGGGFEGAIQDLSAVGLFQPGMGNQRPLSPSLLKGDWTQF